MQINIFAGIYQSHYMDYYMVVKCANCALYVHDNFMQICCIVFGLPENMLQINTFADNSQG